MTIAPLASSADGRRFRARVSMADPLVAGDLVVLTTPAGDQLLGQLTSKVPAGDAVAGDTAEDVAHGDGTLLGSLSAEGTVGPVRRRPFDKARIEAASAAVVAAHQAASQAALPVATLQVGQAQLPALLRAGGLNRHTFLCGQSGSGKTYALGVILEQILARTGLRVVVLDPNGDYVRLGELRPDAASTDAEAAARLATMDIRVLRRQNEDADALTVRFLDLTLPAKAAMLELDPLRDREEYNTLLHWMESATSTTPEEVLTSLRGAGPAEQALAQRLENLGIARWEVWPRGRASVTDVLAARPGPRAVVLDLSGFADPRERTLAAVAVLDHLWAHREDKQPVLLVIDEAHNVCTSEPDSALQAESTRRLVQIAGEGRKYGLWMMLSTQRPSKIHPNVLSQCDNLALMRMNSPGDLAELGAVFGFVPPSMLATSPAFAQGEVLLAGGFTPAPVFARMGARLTPEPGSDLRVPLPQDPPHPS